MMTILTSPNTVQGSHSGDPGSHAASQGGLGVHGTPASSTSGHFRNTAGGGLLKPAAASAAPDSTHWGLRWQRSDSIAKSDNLSTIAQQGSEPSTPKATDIRSRLRKLFGVRRGGQQALGDPQGVRVRDICADEPDAQRSACVLYCYHAIMMWQRRLAVWVSHHS